MQDGSVHDVLFIIRTDLACVEVPGLHGQTGVYDGEAVLEHF